MGKNGRCNYCGAVILKYPPHTWIDRINSLRHQVQVLAMRLDDAQRERDRRAAIGLTFQEGTLPRDDVPATHEEADYGL